ncbi:hypothetical protein [Falsiroseomonas sp.]|uniref:hypothetical protein n=1 Tax=Falsiroseomonas sp. TaxID=2870721 RepID=UPI002735F8F1|nr:hypothetical protein [Falsiroseomonas sp.]MDP3417867.1 hypothetical protein [Falsiroseomonas sp.]
MSLVMVARPDGAPGGLTKSEFAAVAAEARRRLAGTEAALDQRAEPGVIQQWLVRVISLIGHPVDADQIGFKIAAMTDLLADVPRRCLTKQSAAAVAVAAGRFFPPAKDLLATIRPETAELERDRDRLRAVLRAAERPAPAAPLTDDQRAAMSAAAKTYLQEAAERRAEREAREMSAAHRDAGARMAAMSPDTSDAEVRAIAASKGPGAALARARLAMAERRRLALSLSATTNSAEVSSP